MVEPKAIALAQPSPAVRESEYKPNGVLRLGGDAGYSLRVAPL